MKMTAKNIIALIFALPILGGCSYNPFIGDNHLTGNPLGGIIGAGAGAGAVAAAGGTKPWIAVGGVAGGMFGYYVTTLRSDAAGIIQGGGQVYQVGDLIGIYLPTDKLFEPNTAVLIPQAAPILDSVATVLNRYPNNNLIISGNTSGFYRSRWEQRLSEKRAKAISAYLWNSGINYFKTPTNDMRKLNYVGHGDYFSIASNIYNEGIRANSRIQITAYPDGCGLDVKKTRFANNISNIDEVTVNRCGSNELIGDYREDCDDIVSNSVVS